MKSIRPITKGQIEDFISDATLIELGNRQLLSEKNQPLGYVGLDSVSKIANNFLNIVNDLISGGATSILSAEQGVVLQGQINGINNILNSDNINLDSVQEIVDAIETIQLSLETILVNDLTSGGTTKALTAEMGKVLKGLIDTLQVNVSELNSSGTKNYKTYFINTVTGNNTTGIYEDSTKPFADIDYVLALPTFKSGDIIWLQNENGVFYFNSQLSNTSITIFSNVYVVLDLSNNINTNFISGGGNNSITTMHVFDLQKGIIKIDKNGGIGSKISADNINVVFKLKELYHNCSNPFIDYMTGSLTFEVNKVSTKSSNLLSNGFIFLNKDIVIREFVCLGVGVSVGTSNTKSKIKLLLISGNGSFVFIGGYYDVGDITTTGICYSELSSAKINFLNSTISTTGGIRLASNTSNGVTISGTIASCDKIYTSSSGEGIIKFINFLADLKLGVLDFYPNINTIVYFENCNIKSDNSPINLIQSNGGKLILKNSVFEVINSVPLITGGASTNWIVKIQGITHNATMISDQEGSGVTVQYLETPYLTENIVTDASITRTVSRTDLGKTIKFTNANPITLTLPTNAVLPLPIGFWFKTKQYGSGNVTSDGLGISMVSDSGFVSGLGETRRYVKTDTDTWSIEGSKIVSDDNKTFTGNVTLPTTTTIGSITSTIISYLGGLRSNAQAQIDTKLSSFGSGTNNFIQKVIGVNLLGNTRVYDDGTNIGIDTVTPTKDFTFGSQKSRKIGVEKSSNTVVGRDLDIEAGRTINYVLNSDFNPLGQTPKNWYGITSAPNSNVYAIVNGGDIYMQTSGTGNFNPLGQTNRSWFTITSAPNGNIYSATDSDIFLQTGGVGNFVGLNQLRNWKDLVSAPNGDIYALVNGGDIYIQKDGIGDFIALGETSRIWGGIYSIANGDVFAISGGVIYKRTSGVGAFVSTSNSVPGSTDITSAPNGNIYTVAFNVGIYMQTNGVGEFLSLNQTVRSWQAITSAPNGNVYACVFGGDIYLQNNDTTGTENLNGGTLRSIAGTGKGLGKSLWQVWTGQKTVSGTDMQVLTKRVEVNEEGLMTLPSTTNAIISADTTGKAVVTKEFLSNELNSPTKTNDNTDVASISNVGVLRYRIDATNSYTDMCMQTSNTTYAWVNIVKNTWV